ncbi:DUF11 domain-containing protein [Wenzhouxiangella sp. XN79A]|uniref:DUF11 domain-containing protein n=1 Tax=Wenzhouxiangella sp. XN79A TaxID=2724193 RepID=UPI00144AF963|nr:DUF11 domain-containing protein [Wenzhouxiangella sp. XN79A]NKI35098.1 DUF11 domain-containing protein [Wenzhouxiangella sp. XN79A]
MSRSVARIGSIPFARALHGALVRAGAVLALTVVASTASAQLAIDPITWDVVGLDSNRPLTSGPELFPVGAEVCNAGVAPSGPLTATMVWDDPDATWIDNRPGSLTTLNFDPLAPGQCLDAYFEIQVTRSAAAFLQSRPYRIIATDGTFTVETPDTRQIVVESLVSQNRNTTNLIRWGQQADQSDWQTLGAGGALNLAVGESYFIELTTETSTGYEQLQSFLTLSNTIFQVIAVETTYSTLTAPASRVPTPNPKLYADGCLWEADVDSPNYLSCLDAGKAGGSIVTTYRIDIISGGGNNVGLEALIYDKSGSSFHYNTDFSQSPGDLVTYDPGASGFSKRFFPDTISIGTTSRLVFTITNPNPVALGGYNFIDNLPAGVEVAAAPNASTTCGGIWNPLPGDTSLAFDIGADVIGPSSSCSIIVDVAAPEGTYDNVSNPLFIGPVDTGLVATDQLVVANQPPPPACLPGTAHSTWTMEPAAGTTVSPLPTTVYNGDNAFAVASFAGRAAGALPAGVQTISTIDGVPANAWEGTGWPLATAPAQLGPGPNEASYFEFTLDTSEFSTNPAEPLTLSFDINPDGGGSWASNVNITTNVHVSVDGGAFTTVLNDNSISKSTWQTRTVDFTPGLATTTIRINASGVAGNTAGETAPLRLDNVSLVGCGPGAPGTLPAPPELGKVFSPATIGAGEISTLSFTVTNPNPASPAGDLTGIDFTDNLPVGVAVAPVPNVVTSCGGTVTADPGSGLIALADGALVAGASCSVAVDVISSAVATHVNVSDFIFADESGQNNTSTGFATANLTVLAPPSIEKSFDPVLVLLGVTPGDLAALEFVITNPNPVDPIAGVAFTDNLPPGLTVAAAPNVLSSGCGLPTITAPPGAATITMTGGDLAAGGVCVISVDVTGPAGTYDNVSSNVSHQVAGVTLEGNNAAAQLVIDLPIPGIALSKQVGLTNLPDGAWQDYLDVQLPTDIYYKLTVENIGEIPLSAISVSDPTLDISSCTWPATLPVADFSAPTAHIAECIVGPITIDAQAETVNVATASATSSSGPVQDIDDATIATVGLAFDKVADRTTFSAAGEVINYTFSVSNSGFASLEGPVVVTDPLIGAVSCPAVATVGDLDNFFDPGESLVCTGSFTTTAANVSSGSVDNTAFATVGGFDSFPDSVSVPLTTADLTLVKDGVIDDGGDGLADPGDVINYSFSVTNTGNVTLNNITLSDPLVTVSGGPISSLAPGAVDASTFTATYIITQADIDAGSLTNIATATSSEGAGDTDTDTQFFGIGSCALPGSDGNATGLSGVLNTFWRPSDGIYNGASGGIALNDRRGQPLPLIEGDLVLVMQMQCADLDFSDTLSYGNGTAGEPASGFFDTPANCRAGGYEFVTAGPASDNTFLDLSTTPLVASYEQAAATATNGRRTFQVIRVPQYLNAQLGGPVTTVDWDGDTGGLVVLDVALELDLNGQAIDVDGAGFRGGGGLTASAADPIERFRWDDPSRHGAKGEGIAGTPRFLSTKRTPDDGATAAVIDLGTGWGGYPTGTASSGDFARGAPANAGGGGTFWSGSSDNGGGGGGGNAGAGGQGAAGWRSAGYGGILADYSNLPEKKWGFGGSIVPWSIQRVFLGGGGGAGDNNSNSLAVQSSGAAGGGIVMLRAETLLGTGSISARGGRATDNPSNDGAGGGGAGGSVVVVATNWSATLDVVATGGRGGDAWATGTAAHGSGGGGGGGLVLTTAAPNLVDISGGSPGVTTTTDSPPGGPSHGAQSGQDGIAAVVSAGSDGPGAFVGRTCRADLAIIKTNPESPLLSGQATTYTLTVTNNGPLPANGARVTDTPSAGLSLTTVSCSASGGAVCPVGPLDVVDLLGGGIEIPDFPPGSTITLTVDAVVTATGL